MLLLVLAACKRIAAVMPMLFWQIKLPARNKNLLRQFPACFMPAGPISTGSFPRPIAFSGQ